MNIPNKSALYGAWLLVAIIPLAITFFLVTLLLQASIEDFVPRYWNDQIGFWHYILTFKEAGFNGGYYALNEHIATLDLARFDVKGPIYPMLMGTLARLTGWQPYTPIYLNALLLGCATFAFLFLIRAGWRQTGVTGAVVLTFWVIPMYIPTSSQESFHQAGALLSAAVFYHLLRDQRRAKVVGLVLILILGAVRFSWALMLLPLLALWVHQRSLPIIARNVAVAVGLLAAVMMFASYTNTPNVNSVLVGIRDLPSQPTTIVDTIRENARHYLEYPLHSPNLTQFFMIIIVMTFFPVMWWKNKTRDHAALTEMLFHEYTLGSIVALSFILYLPEGYYRIFGTNLLISLLVLIAMRRFKLVGVVLLLNLVAFPTFLDQYQGWQPNFELNPDELKQQQRALGTFVHYDPDAPSPWCNTLLIPVENYDYRVTLIPAGIGVTWLWDRVEDDLLIRPPIQSRYLLMSGTQYDTLRQQVGYTPGELIAVFPFGNLYYNTATPCDPLPILPQGTPNAQLGLQDDVYAEYQDFLVANQVLDPNSKILFPFNTPSLPSRDQQILTWSDYLNSQTLGAQEKHTLFTLLNAWEGITYIGTLPEARLSALDAWRNGKLPADLNAAGFEYLLSNDRWMSYLSNEEIAVLEQSYTLVWQLQDPITLATYTLYRATVE